MGNPGGFFDKGKASAGFNPTAISAMDQLSPMALFRSCSSAWQCVNVAGSPFSAALWNGNSDTEAGGGAGIWHCTPLAIDPADIFPGILPVLMITPQANALTGDFFTWTWDGTKFIIDYNLAGGGAKVSDTFVFQVLAIWDRKNQAAGNPVLGAKALEGNG